MIPIVPNVLTKVLAAICVALIVACLWFKLQAVEATGDLRLAQHREEVLETALEVRIKAAKASKEVAAVREGVRDSRKVEHRTKIKGDSHALETVPEWADTAIPESVASRLRE